MRKKGFFWEKIAGIYLFLKGYRILEFNYRTRFGEIDIICKEKDTVVFVEVKYRKNAQFGIAEEFVDERKIRKIVKTAKDYILKKRLDNNFRFDVIAINRFKINHIKNAFEGE